MLMPFLFLALKDGFTNKTAFSLLRDIDPDADPEDRDRIGNSLNVKNQADFLCDIPPKAPHHLQRPLSARERMFGLLRVLKKYSGKQGEDAFTSIERMLDMQKRVQQMQNAQNIMPLMMEMLNQSGAKLPDFSNVMQMGNIGNLLKNFGGAAF